MRPLNLKKLWLWIIGRRVRNGGRDAWMILKITGDDFVQLHYSWTRGSEAPMDIMRMSEDGPAMIIGPFPKRIYGKNIYVDAGKNKVEVIRVPRPRKKETNK